MSFFFLFVCVVVGWFLGLGLLMYTLYPDISSWCLYEKRGCDNLIKHDWKSPCIYHPMSGVIVDRILYWSYPETCSILVSYYT